MPAPETLHALFERLGYVAAAIVYWRSARQKHLTPAVLAGAALGAALGARLLYLLCDPAHNVLLGGKTIVGGLLGGLIGVELAKKLAGIERSTGDAFVIPLITAMSIGRIGCFLAGPADHTAGNPTSLPWAIAMGDAVPRHPVALYEIAFLLALAPLVAAIRRQSPFEGDSFRFFLASYLAFRFAVDFLKPEPHVIAAGLTSIQWACLAGIGYYGFVLTSRTWRRDDRPDSPLPLL